MYVYNEISCRERQKNTIYHVIIISQVTYVPQNQDVRVRFMI